MYDIDGYHKQIATGVFKSTDGPVLLIGSVNEHNGFLHELAIIKPDGEIVSFSCGNSGQLPRAFNRHLKETPSLNIGELRELTSSQNEPIKVSYGLPPYLGNILSGTPTIVNALVNWNVNSSRPSSKATLIQSPSPSNG